MNHTTEVKMKNTNQNTWQIGENTGYFFQRPDRSLYLVTHAEGLVATQRQRVVHDKQELHMELVGLDLRRNIALLKPLCSTPSMTRTIPTLKTRSIAEALELDIADLALTLGSLWTGEHREDRTYRDYKPKEWKMRKQDFAALQQSSKSPFGTFSRDEQGNIYEGWSSDSRRRQLDAPHVWRHLALSLPCSSNFFLRGLEVVSYRGKYNQGFTVPRIIKLR